MIKRKYEHAKTAVIVIQADGADFIQAYGVVNEDDYNVTVVAYHPEKPFDKYERITVTKKRTVDYPSLIELY